MTTSQWDPTGVYSGLGVSPIINAGGPITRLGGSRTRPGGAGRHVQGRHSDGGS